jgi:hypothetical protein
MGEAVSGRCPAGVKENSLLPDNDPTLSDKPHAGFHVRLTQVAWIRTFTPAMHAPDT